jgi:hypothetical protein
MHTAVIQHLTISWLGGIHFNALLGSTFSCHSVQSHSLTLTMAELFSESFPRNSRSQAFLRHHDSKLINKSFKPLMKQINQMMMMKNKKQSSESERIHRAREIKKKIFFCCYFGKNPK